LLLSHVWEEYLHLPPVDSKVNDSRHAGEHLGEQKIQHATEQRQPAPLSNGWLKIYPHRCVGPDSRLKSCFSQAQTLGHRPLHRAGSVNSQSKATDAGTNHHWLVLSRSPPASATPQIQLPWHRTNWPHGGHSPRQSARGFARHEVEGAAELAVGVALAGFEFDRSYRRCALGVAGIQLDPAEFEPVDEQPSPVPAQRLHAPLPQELAEFLHRVGPPPHAE